MSVETEIKTILQTVSGIGKIYDGYVNVVTEKEVNERLKFKDKINSIFFIETADIPESQESFYLKETKRTFRFALYYGYNLDKNSTSIVKTLKNSIMDAFNSNETLNDSVTEHDNLRMLDNIFVSFTSILCHLIIFEMTVTQEMEVT